MSEAQVRPSPRGRFITIEGVEGSGKSTQIVRLRQHLEARGHDVAVTREPGGTPIAEAIRQVLLDPANSRMCATAELLLYEAARAQHVAERIRPALDAGKVVLCDRFADSTTAYQGAGRGLAPDVVARLHDVATNGTWPDLTIVIDVPVEVGLARAARNGRPDRIEREDVEFHDKVRGEFLRLAADEPHRVKIVDGTPSEDEIAPVIARLADTLLEGA